MYSDNQKTVEQEDDVKAIIRPIGCCYKAISFSYHINYQ